MLRPYRDVLSRPGALAFSAAGTLARLPMSMAGIGVVLMVSALYGSYGVAGRVSAVYAVAQALCAPQLARLVDRHGQARVMRPALAVATLGGTGLLVAALLHAPTGWLYATALVAGAGGGSFGSLARARWSWALRDDPRRMHTAHALESALDEVVFIVGPALATLLATSVHPTAGLVVPVAALVVGGYLFLALRRTEPPVTVHDDATPRPRGSVLRSPAMVVIVLVCVAMGTIFGATDVSTVAFADEAGHKGVAGLVLAVFACGSLVSGLLYGARHWTRPLYQRYAVGMVALAVGVSLFVVVRSLPALAAVMFVTGFTIAPTLINANGLVQQIVAPGRLTEGLTWVGTAIGLGVSVGSSVAGTQIDAHGSRAGFLVVVAAGGCAVLATLVALPALRAAATAHVRQGTVAASGEDRTA